MKYSDMTAQARGFTMIELLVTLVLLGLIAAVVAPGLDSWVSARQAAAARTALASQFATLPLKASQQSESLVIESADQLGLEGVALTFKEPVVILANGFCKGGQGTLELTDRRYPFSVLPPYCELHYDRS